MGNHLKSAEARLERRIDAYVRTKKTPEQGFHRPGSTRKPAAGAEVSDRDTITISGPFCWPDGEGDEDLAAFDMLDLVLHHLLFGQKYPDVELDVEFVQTVPV